MFDVPHLAGEPTIGLTYSDRRRLLELLELNGPSWCTVPSFDAEADDVLEGCARLRLEGLVAKRVEAVAGLVDWDRSERRQLTRSTVRLADGCFGVPHLVRHRYPGGS